VCFTNLRRETRHNVSQANAATGDAVWAQRFGGSLLDGSTVAGQGMAAAVDLSGAALVAASFQGSLCLADAAGRQATLTAGVQPGLFLSNAFVLKLGTTGSVQVGVHFAAPFVFDQARKKGSGLSWGELQWNETCG
jgi:hypothetical protein